jgi:hypothetical protein
MKKTLLLSSIIALGALSAMGQGFINANNFGQGTFITIQDTTGVLAGGAAEKIGTPATAAGFVGAGPGQVTIDIYAALQGTSLANLKSSTPIFAGLNSTLTSASFQGTASPGNPFTLPTSPGVFDGTAAIELIAFATTTINGVVYSGYSTEATGITPATGTGTVPAVWGTTAGLMGSLNMIAPIPEPSTIVLGGLGAAALLAFRRRNK